SSELAFSRTPGSDLATVRARRYNCACMAFAHRLVSVAAVIAAALATVPRSIEQQSQGSRRAIATVETFDGLGAGFEGPQGPAAGRNPSDNSLAVGPRHIVQIVNSRMAIFSKTGKVLYGAVVTNSIFQGFG